MGTGKTRVVDRRMVASFPFLFHIIFKIKRTILYVYAHTHISKKKKKVQGCCTEVWKVGFGTGRSEP